ncbi:acyl-CoA dehydrogenase [Brevibacterium antiquum]|uniref:acyl-CoA dehydrogenase n=1 Tax=Brevibacterium antiquum TaxID=234835 RepID=UPI0018DFBC60|nr:acyl-CoA dehydrogenase [Brevibacterium antiquum]
MKDSIAIGDELTELTEVLDDFCTDRVSPETIHAYIDAEDEGVPGFFSDLTDIGILDLHLDEEQGGAGVGFMGLATAAEALGRGLVPGPALPAMITSASLAHAGRAPQTEGAAGGPAAALGAIALEPGDLAFDAATCTLTGTSAPITSAATAEHVVLPVDDGSWRRWVLLHTSATEVLPCPSHDVTRPMARLRIEQAASVEVLDIDPELPRLIAAAALAAEGSGIAQWCTETAVEYARVREQFGAAIGSFQAVKHRIAGMHVAAAQVRALAWDAARCLDTEISTDERSLVISAAAGTGIDLALDTVKDLIDTLGGIGFTWEHMAGFALRRAQTSRVVLGPGDHWRVKVAQAALAGARRGPALSYPEGSDKIREEIGAELDTVPSGDEATARLADLGFTSPALPRPWGRGADALTQLIIDEELTARNLTPHDMVIGNWVVPSLVAHGTPEQNERFIGPSLRGDIRWCQLFSEPGAGSDLAGLTTSARKVDGGWVITGQKVWTSGARESDWGILLARTDPEARKHRGIGYFLLDMNSPGITIRPLRELTGEALFNEVFLDEVFIPDELMVGAPTDGWKVAVGTLANERVAMTGHSMFGGGDEALVSLLHGYAADDPLRLRMVGDLLSVSLSGSLLGVRSMLKAMESATSSAESSLAKLVSTRNIQDTWEAVVEWSGTDGIDGVDIAGAEDVATRSTVPTYMFLNTRSLTIAGGTTDIQLNIVAERILGLPRG